MNTGNEAQGKWNQRCSPSGGPSAESEGMFRLLFERSTDPIWLFDPRAGVFVDCNQAAVDLMRCGTKEKLLQTRPFDLAPPFQPDGRPSHEVAVEITQLVERNGGHRFEWLGRRSDGTLVPAEVVATPIVTNGQTLHVVVSRDISERKRAELALIESQQLLSSIADNLNEAIYRTTPEHQLIFVNRSYLRIFGYESLADLQSIPREQLYADPAKRGPLLERLRREGRFSEEVEFVRRNGARFWALSNCAAVRDAKSGQVVYHVGSISEITVRKEIEANLRASEERWRLLFEQSPLSVQIFAPDGSTRRVNRAWENLFGALRERIDRFNILQDQQLIENGSMQTIRRAFAGEVVTIPPRPFELRLRPDEPSQGLKWVGSLLFPVLDDRGRVLEVVCIHEDITDRHSAEEEVRQLNATLERRIADRTAELSASEARARTLVEHAPEAIVVFDGETGIFVECNENATQLYGLPRHELIGCHPAELSPEFQPDGRRSMDAARDVIQRAIDGQTPVFDWTHRHSSGRLIPCEVRLVRLPAEGKALMRGSVIDNTERKRREQVQQATFQISEAVHTADDLNHLYQRIHSIVKGLMPAGNFYIALFDSVTELISFPYFVDEHGGKPAPFKITTGLTGYVLRTNRPLLLDRKTNARKKIVGDRVTFEGHPEISYKETGRPAAIWLGVPLSIGGRPLGVMAVQDYHNDLAYGEEEKQILSFVAAQIALAIDRKRAEQELRERTERVLRHRNVLLELAQLDKSNFEAAVERICTLSAATLSAARASYWSLRENGTAIGCELLYLRATDEFVPEARGLLLHTSDYPAYFAALAGHQPIAAGDAVNHPATRELADGYLKPLGIGAMLDVPVWLHGRVVGVLCHENIGPPRDWTVEEIDFASSLATMVALALEAAQRARSEQALRESELKHRALFEGSSQGVLLHDEEQILEVNPAAVGILRCESAAEIVGRHPIDLAPERQPNGELSAALARGYIAECMDRGSSRFDWQSLSPRGELVSLEVFLTRITMGGRHIIQAAINDIADRKRAEEELRQSEARLRESEARFSAAFHASPVYITIARVSDGRFIEANDAFVQWVGYSRAEILGRTSVELGIWANLGERDGYWEELNSQGRVRNRECQLATRRGALHLMLLSADVIEINKEPHVLTVGLDISDRKKAEIELLRALGREKELSQLKSDFVSTVSHEFRTPLGIIMSSAEILEDYLEELDRDERQHHLRSIARNTKRMSEMMEEVLVLGRLDAGRMDFKPAPLELRSFCGRLVEEVQSATSRACPIELSFRDLGETAAVSADERLLRHILLNLLTNAVKYSEAGRGVEFVVQREDKDIVCRIRDHGIGIPEGDLSWLFSAFHRGRNVGQRPGTGLGLVIVKRCVELHGGTIHVESKLGQGTLMTVRIAAEDVGKVERSLS